MKLLPFILILFFTGCAQFNGMESESQQGLIPEILILGSGGSLVAENELIQEQAQYYTASSRAMYFEAMVKKLKNNSAKNSYKRKALKAQQIALRAEDSVTSLSK